MTTHVSEHCRTPKWWLARFAHRPWVCSCGQGWTTYSYMGFWTWRKWPKEEGT